MTKKAFDKIKAGLDEALEAAKKEPTKGEDFKVEFAPEVEAKMKEDPAMAEMVRSVIAMIRQAGDGTTSEEEMDDNLRKAGFERIELEDGDDPE